MKAGVGNNSLDKNYPKKFQHIVVDVVLEETSAPPLDSFFRLKKNLDIGRLWPITVLFMGIPIGCSTNEDAYTLPCLSMQRPVTMADNQQQKLLFLHCHHLRTLQATWKWKIGVYWLLAEQSTMEWTFLLATPPGLVLPQSVSHRQNKMVCFGLKLCCVFPFWTQCSAVKS